jgi:hypothetical protein
MNDQQNKKLNSENIDRVINGLTGGAAPAVLLFAGGIVLGVGYTLHLAGFGGWMTLAIGGASLFAAGAVWGNLRRFALLAVGVALFGAILCTTALPGQLRSSATAAAAVNLGVILSQLAAVFLIMRIRQSPIRSRQKPQPTQ